MVWMTLVSFRRNLRKYSLAIISLALAVTVSCLGLSGLELLQRSTTQPLAFLAGGQIMIIDERTNLRPAGSRIYADPLEIKPYPVQLAEELIEDTTTRAKAVHTLVAPFMRYREAETSAFYLAGRNQLPASISALSFLEGETLADGHQEMKMVIPGEEYVSPSRTFISAWYRMETGSTYPLNIPHTMKINDSYDWDIAAATEHNYTVNGIYDQRNSLYPLFWTDIEHLQSQVGGPRLVSWVGVPCADAQIASLKSELETKVTDRNLPLRVLSLRDLGEMLIGGFEKFEKMANYYTPVMLFVAVQIVLVNAVAIVMTRRKELALLRTIGFSLLQIQAMFVVECFFTALSGALLGTGLAALIALGVSKSPAVSYVPFVLTIVTTTLISLVATLIIGRGSLSQTLRNPAA